MSGPTLKERKEFWLWNYAGHCFEQVIQSLDYLKRLGPKLPDSVCRVLTTGIIVTYSKPFTRCDGVERLQENVVPSEYASLHTALICFRDKVLAHIDASPKDPRFRDINQVRISISDGRYNAHVMTPDRDFLGAAPELDQLVKKMLDKANYHNEKFVKKYIPGASLPSGEYLLSVDPQDSVAFVPAKPIFSNASGAFKEQS